MARAYGLQSPGGSAFSYVMREFSATELDDILTGLVSYEILPAVEATESYVVHEIIVTRPPELNLSSFGPNTAAAIAVTTIQTARMRASATTGIVSEFLRTSFIASPNTCLLYTSPSPRDS